jgi:hypothetical protein
VPGVSFPAWHLGAVRFSLASSGIGLSTNEMICYQPLRTGRIAVGYHPPVNPVGDDVERRTFVAADRLLATRDCIPCWRPVARTAGRDVALGGVTVRTPNIINPVGANDFRPGVE